MAVFIEVKCSTPESSKRIGAKFSDIVHEENKLLVKNGENPIELNICKALWTSCDRKDTDALVCLKMTLQRAYYAKLDKILSLVSLGISVIALLFVLFM